MLRNYRHTAHMNKIAIDIVLLPSPAMTAQAVAVSQGLAQNSGNTKIVLDEQRCLPHISLRMGVVNEEDIPEITIIVQKIAKSMPPLKLVASGIVSHAIPTGEHLVVIEVDTTPKLQRLYDIVRLELAGKLSFDLDASMYHNPSEIEQISLHWAKAYADDAFIFYPHITSGFGSGDITGFPVNFMASTLAVCQLGNYCTCRRLIATHDMQPIA